MLVSSTEPKKFHSLGTLSTGPEDFGVDFMWHVLRDEQHELWGVQRKEIKDLVSSADDGRLTKESAQIAALHQAILIIEGTPTFTLDGQLVLPGRRGTRNRWNRPDFAGLLLSLQHKGFWVLITGSSDETIEAIRAAERWSRKPEHHSLDHRPGPRGVWGSTPTEKDWALHVLQSAPGVGPAMAKAIFAKHGLPIRLTVTREQLMEVPGCGPKKADKIIAAFGGDPGADRQDLAEG